MAAGGALRKGKAFLRRARGDSGGREAPSRAPCWPIACSRRWPPRSGAAALSGWPAKPAAGRTGGTARDRGQKGEIGRAEMAGEIRTQRGGRFSAVASEAEVCACFSSSLRHAGCRAHAPPEHGAETSLQFTPEQSARFHWAKDRRSLQQPRRHKPLVRVENEQAFTSLCVRAPNLRRRKSAEAGSHRERRDGASRFSTPSYTHKSVPGAHSG